MNRRREVIDAKKNRIQFNMRTAKLDLLSDPDQSDGVVGLSFGTRCFMEAMPTCKNTAGVFLLCKS